MRSMVRLIATGLLLTVLSSACGGGGDTATDTGNAPSVSSASSTQANLSSPASDAGKDACAALPRATIEQVVGADPGEGELEHAATSTVCRYYGDGQVTVEIDLGSDVAQARASIEAYGDTCNEIDDIGDQALFCTGGIPALGSTGQIVWTDGQRTYYVVYNFGDETPSQEATLDLARHLQP